MGFPDLNSPRRILTGSRCGSSAAAMVLTRTARSTKQITDCGLQNRSRSATVSRTLGAELGDGFEIPTEAGEFGHLSRLPWWPSTALVVYLSNVASKTLPRRHHRSVAIETLPRSEPSPSFRSVQRSSVRSQPESASCFTVSHATPASGSGSSGVSTSSRESKKDVTKG